MTERAFCFELPTRIEFGAGVSRHVGERAMELGARRVLVVTDPGVAAAGIAERIIAGLERTQLAHDVFGDVTPEPEASGVVAGVEAARAHGADAVVGVGGGSALDTAKAIAVMVTNEGHIRDYEGQERIPNPGLPVIALPTTAGTGSEVTIWAVISDKEQRTKYGIGGRYLTASIGLCDPELTLTLPPAVTASTGMDALAHALESFVNRATQPISEALAARAMEMIGRSLRRAVFAGGDLRARSEMLLASTMAAMAFNPTRLGDAHALAMPLGASHEIPHSVVIAILLPAVVEFNVVASVEKFAAIARLLGEAVDGGSPRAAAEKAVEAVRRLREDLPIPRGLAEYDVREEHLPRLAEEAMASGNVPVNPRMTTADDLVEIMRRAM